MSTTSKYFSIDSIFKVVNELDVIEMNKRLEMENKAHELLKKNLDSFTRLMASAILHQKDSVPLVFTMSGACGQPDVEKELLTIASGLLIDELFKLNQHLKAEGKVDGGINVVGLRMLSRKKCEKLPISAPAHEFTGTYGNGFSGIDSSVTKWTPPQN